MFLIYPEKPGRLAAWLVTTTQKFQCSGCLQGLVSTPLICTRFNRFTDPPSNYHVLILLSNCFTYFFRNYWMLCFTVHDSLPSPLLKHQLIHCKIFPSIYLLFTARLVTLELISVLCHANNSLRQPLCRSSYAAPTVGPLPKASFQFIS